MAGVFAPSRDLDACDLVIVAYEELHRATRSRAAANRAAKLRAARGRVAERLPTPPSDASVSSFFLEALQKEGWGGAALGEYGRAIREARRPRENEPRTARKALRYAEAATSLNPLSSLAWETLGDVHSELQDFRSARHAWEYARSRDPDNPRLYDKIGSSHWQIAFDGHSWVDKDALHDAEGYLQSALLLYRSGNFEEQQLTRYRLAKLYTALGEFAKARSHIKIVEAVSEKPPLVGWQLLGQAHLRERLFGQCEYYFRQVIKEYGELKGLPADGPIGHPIDERYWPLALVRAWGHLGLAFSNVERDGDLDEAEERLGDARRLARSITKPDLFPTRIEAACMDCEAFICQRRKGLDDAIVKFAEAVGMFPYSRAYLHLALAHIARARTSSDGRDDIDAAGRALNNAASLRPADLPCDEITEAREELAKLASRLEGRRNSAETWTRWRSRWRALSRA
jgi:tetratricopeptide (TPR) repeat protein